MGHWRVSNAPTYPPIDAKSRANGASETRYCIITPSARRGSGGRMGHRRPTITRRFADALLPPEPESDRASGHAFS